MEKLCPDIESEENARRFLLVGGEVEISKEKFEKYNRVDCPAFKRNNFIYIETEEALKTFSEIILTMYQAIGRNFFLLKKK